MGFRCPFGFTGSRCEIYIQPATTASTTMQTMNNCGSINCLNGGVCSTAYGQNTCTYVIIKS